VKGKQIGKRVLIVLGFGEHAIFVKAGNDSDGFRHEMVRIANHVVALLKLLLRKIP
jgi:hypothetical protein